MVQEWNNIVIVAGSSQNVGKTTFICRVLNQAKEQSPIAVKISSHFHQPTNGLKLISEDGNYQLFEETNQTTKKDSSLYLQNGAGRSFYIQSKDEFLPDAFLALLPFLTTERPIIIESAALHKHVAAGLFLFIYNDQGEQKYHTEANLKIADIIVRSDGQNYSLQPEQLKFHEGWKIIR